MTAAAPSQSLWRSVAPEQIDAELADLWREAAREGPISRASMSNLVVVSERAETAPLDGRSEIVQVAQRHPARVILLHYRPETHRPSALAGASIGVLTFGRPPARYGVEVIAVSAACADVCIPSIVRRLTHSDVPTTVWWTDDLSHKAPPAALVATGRQLLYDSASWRDVHDGTRAAAAILALPYMTDISDLNWRRLAPLRHAIVHALQSETAARTLAPADVRVRHRPGEASAAWLLVGWLRCRLKWTGADAVPAVEEIRHGDDLVGIGLRGPDWQVTATMSRQRITVEIGAGRPPFTMPVPREAAADAIVAELRTLGHDTCLSDAVLSLADVSM